MIVDVSMFELIYIFNSFVDVDSWAGRWFPDSPTSTNRKSNPNAIDPGT